MKYLNSLGEFDFKLSTYRFKTPIKYVNLVNDLSVSTYHF